MTGTCVGLGEPVPLKNISCDPGNNYSGMVSKEPAKSGEHINSLLLFCFFICYFLCICLAVIK